MLPRSCFPSPTAGPTRRPTRSPCAVLPQQAKPAVSRRWLLGHVQDNLAGNLESRADGCRPRLDLAFGVVAARFGMGQAGEFQRQWQQVHKLADALLL